MPNRLILLAFVATAIVFSGCSRQFVMPRYDAVDPRDAFNELFRRRATFSDFKATAIFDISSDRGNVRVKCLMNLSKGKFWRIDLDGPLGVKLAIIETDSTRFRIQRPQTGQVYTGWLTDPLPIPELELEIQQIDRLTAMLLPVIDLSEIEDWNILNARYGNPGMLNLKRQSDGGDSLIIRLDYAPLRVISEERWRYGEVLFRRDFYYKEQRNTIPSEIDVSFDDFNIVVKHSKFKFNNSERRITKD